MDEKLVDDLRSGKVEEVPNSISLFIFSYLGLIPKHDKGWRKIDDLSYHIERPVNDYISDNTGEMRYTWF